MDYVLTIVINYKYHQQPQIIIKRFANQATAEAIAAFIEKYAKCNTTVTTVNWEVRKDK